MRRWWLAAALAVAGCTSSVGGHGSSTPTPTTPISSRPHTTTTPAPSSSRPSSSRSTAPAGSSTPPVSPAAAAFARMSERQRIGQLLMVDCPTSGVTDATAQAIQQYQVGSVILDGTTYAGSAEMAALTRDVQSLAPKGVRLLVATDQEGGQVQRLQGPGFTRIPPATEQGTYPTSLLYPDARQWGRELRRAGVNVNLAPVLDVVPPGFGANPPIGDLDREFGHRISAAENQGVAVARGFQAAGVAPTVKHFPGLGRVHGNTDLSTGVTDTVTTANDSYLEPFRVAIRSGVPFVMMSTAIYARLDPGVPAAFSARIVTGMLRQRFGFRGVVVSDDLGGAAQVADLSPGERAVRFVDAGGDLVLTVNAGQAQEMTAALLASARANPAFRAKVDAAALRILTEKQRLGLLG